MTGKLGIRKIGQGQFLDFQITCKNCDKSQTSGAASCRDLLKGPKAAAPKNESRGNPTFVSNGEGRVDSHSLSIGKVTIKLVLFR